MARRTHLWAGLSVAIALVAGGALSWAQDFPTFRGNNERTGRNTGASVSSPGRANLRWWHPGGSASPGAQIVRDNTSKRVTKTSGWSSPSTGGEASSVYIPSQTGDSAVDSLVSSFFDPTSPNFGQRPITPGYEFAIVTPSATFANFDNYDPTVPLAGTARTFAWDLTPADASARNYAVYVWIPTGPTDIDPGAGVTLVYPQRYYVFEVLYSGKRHVEIVDTSASGTGWVRLGNGGLPTDRLFPYNGTGSLIVRLYNTVPRDRNGNLMGQTGGATISLVYADAARAEPIQGTYTASTIINTLSDASRNVVAARNEYSVDSAGRTVAAGVVRSFDLDTGTVRWTFSPTDNSGRQIVVDAPSSQVTPNPPSWSAQTAASGYLGANYFSAPLAASRSAATDVRYQPSLPDGEYAISMWLAGSNGGQLFARRTVVEIHEGSTVTDVVVDQDSQSRWVRLGNRRFSHRSTAPLQVRVLNFSTDANDALEGRLAYADAMAFNGGPDLAVKSTPVQVNGALLQMVPGDPLVPTDVTLVASEDGRIYCLESNATSTPRVLWAYPSLRDPLDPSWTDPNHTNGEDGEGPVAEMPTGFDLSSALVQRIDGRDYLFVAARNGRVYCIDMAGRGDMNLATGKAGTTRRIWTWPDDYPSTSKTSSLGSFVGSLAFANTADGPTILVPARQGRLYALDARGTSGKKTTVRWQFPALDQPTLGEIVSTPVVAFGKVFFGALPKVDETNGEFLALNVDDGSVAWRFSGTTSLPTDGWVASPTAVPGVLLGAGEPDTVFAANENGTVYAFDANGSGGSASVRWTTSELATSFAGGGLTFTTLRVLNNLGTLTPTPVPCVLVPTAEGRLVALFARLGDVNRVGGRRAWEYVLAGGLVGHASAGRNWLTVADTRGYLYAFNDDTGLLTPGEPPGSEGVVENNPVADNFRNARIKLIDAETYRQLRAGTLNYAQADAAAEVGGSPLAFEWGERIYVLVYRYPHATQTPDGDAVPPPSVNFLFNAQGSATRTITVESRQFPIVSGSNPPTATDGTRLDGYAVIDFAIQPGGANAMPPGDGSVTATITTRSLNDNGQQQTINLDPANSVRSFKVANPLALVITTPADALRTVGYSVNPSDPENLINGSNVPGTQKNRLLASVGLVAHGQSGGVTISVVDRSLMRLLRGPGRGLDNVRVEARQLNWLGGSSAVLFPLDPNLYPGYEDLPTRFPNDSLDYPDIGASAVRVTKSAFGTTENPLFAGASLIPPSFPDEANPAPAQRTLNPTPFDFEVRVPRFQPPNSTPLADSAGVEVPAGYAGRLYVLVDSNGNGRLDLGSGLREAYRSFRLASPVDVDERFSVRTPVVDAGMLPIGAGFAPTPPWDPASPLHPLNGPFRELFKPFTVVNEGNVNLLNLRLAKATQLLAGPLNPWPIYSQSNHDAAWLETATNVFSNLDPDARWIVRDDNGNNHPNVVLQKARPGDRVGTQLDLNATRRANPVTGVQQGKLSSSLPDPYPPSVAVTVPLGLPSGVYQQILRVINEVRTPTYPANLALSLDQYGGGLEAYSDPTFTLRFTVREGRLTNAPTRLSAPLVEDVVTGSERFLNPNLQPTMARAANGSLLVAWSSPRDSFGAPAPGANAPADPAYRIFLSTLRGTTPAAVTGPNNLRELNWFTPAAADRWFSQPTDAPYPNVPNQAAADALFGVDTANGQAVVLNTMKFGLPTLPSLGFVDPFNGSDLGTAYLAFVGEAQVQTLNGRANQSRLFLAPVQVAASGQPTVGAPIRATKDDPGLRKSRLSLVQTGDRATVFFAATTVGGSQISYTTYNPSVANIDDRWSPIRSISLGSGFEQLASPSVSARVYAGAPIAAGGFTLNPGTRLLEMAFVGKLRGRPNSEVFLARMVADANGAPVRLAAFPPRQNEALEAVGGGVYRAQGVSWFGGFAPQLWQRLNGTLTNLEVPNTRRVDPSTGIVTFETRLGGRVTLDPNAGLVRFGTATPSQRAVLLLTYQPFALRVSGAGQTASHSTPNVLFDNRLIADASYWVRPGGAAVSNADADPIRTSRYLVAYGRSAAGGGQSARPFLRSFRLGVQLPAGVLTNPDGTVVSLAVVGATGPYQIDPARGRVYFTDVDEGRAVSIAFQGVTEDGQPIAVPASTYGVGLIPEQEEFPIPIAQPVNESSPFLSLDPFDPAGAIGTRRPGLIWMVWTSTRAGVPDLYLQTLAPRFSPIPASR
ncbi:MAG: hypothetical protein N2109_11045 [Fimbriimonadales bacterium]|nr:hypothetical protein [Fimbriimonadales bacterium]